MTKVLDQQPKSAAEIDALLAGEEFRYQRVELPHGRIVGVRDRSSTATAVLPADLAGKSVLDIGCNYGALCFDAKKRGAARVVGVDVNADSLRRARLLAQCLGSDAEFTYHDIERQPFTESFDYVLCLNVLHHVKDPLSLLDNLIKITRERLALEVATLGSHDGRRLRLSVLSRYFLNRLPIIYIPASSGLAKRQDKSFYFTAGAIKNLLLDQRRVFASLDILPSDFKGRFLAVAHKRRIGHLVVLAGPTSSGKRTVAKALTNGEIPEVTRLLGVDDPALFGPSTQDGMLREPGPAAIERMLLRYDILRPRFTNAHILDRDPVLGVLDTATRRSFVTIFAPPEALRQQLAAVEGDKRRWSKKHRRVLAHYGDAAALAQDYLDWFAFTERFAGEHLVVLPRDGMRVVPMQEFRPSLHELMGVSA